MLECVGAVNGVAAEPRRHILFEVGNREVVACYIYVCAKLPLQIAGGFQCLVGGIDNECAHVDDSVIIVGVIVAELHNV